MTTLLLTTLLCLAALTSASQARHWPETPLISVLNQQALKIRQARANRCLSAPVFRWHPGYRVPQHLRAFVIRQRQARLARNRALPVNCEYQRALSWHRSSPASCVRSKEGGLTSVNPAGPYYGWYQTDPDFQATYGREFVRAYGHGIWPARAQILTAYRGWRARGWYPWPNTARACGLL